VVSRRACPPRTWYESEPRVKRRQFLKAAGLGAASLVAARARAVRAETPARRPNVIIFFTDDQGYNDVGCFGSPRIRTPHFDRMAAEGMRLTSFYAQAVCGPSRAAIMTGCYPIRVAEPGNRKNQHTILDPREVTIAEVLKGAGYATACIGKWHLAGSGGGRGHGPFPAELMPTAQGFDSFFGTPLHNGFTREPEPKRFVTELMRGGEVLESPTDMDLLTKRYTEEAVRFIRANKDRPFFLYLAHNMPHVPLGASKAFRGRSPRGLYGDVIEELDWSAGRVISTLTELGLDEHTLVVFTSDNGPWIEKHLGDYGGSADPLRGSKMMTWDGGPRVPCIMRWPGHVPAGRVCDDIATTMDLLPTVARLAGARVPGDRVLDGVDLGPLITGKPGAKSPRETFYYYCYTHLQAVRNGKWKLVLPRPARPPWTGWSARMVDAVPQAQLYDLASDIEEKHDVADRHPEIVARLTALVEKARDDLGDHDRVGKGARFFDGPPPASADRRDGRRRRKT
jgi:arylsulfatase A-like enzyme